jgi:hypothetical protein
LGLLRSGQGFETQAGDFVNPVQGGGADASTTLKFYGFAISKSEVGTGLLDELLP